MTILNVNSNANSTNKWRWYVSQIWIFEIVNKIIYKLLFNKDASMNERSSSSSLYYHYYERERQKKNKIKSKSYNVASGIIVFISTALTQT